MNPLAYYHLLLERLLGPDGDVAAAESGFLTPIAATTDPDEVEGLLEVAPG